MMMVPKLPKDGVAETKRVEAAEETPCEAAPSGPFNTTHERRAGTELRLASRRPRVRRVRRDGNAARMAGT